MTSGVNPFAAFDSKPPGGIVISSGQNTGRKRKSEDQKRKQKRKAEAEAEAEAEADAEVEAEAKVEVTVAAKNSPLPDTLDSEPVRLSL